MKPHNEAAAFGSSGPRPGTAEQLVLAAFARIEEELRAGRAQGVERLHADLLAMARTIAEAKATVAPNDTAIRAVDIEALLNELEVRVDAMMEIVGAAPAAPAASGPDAKPAQPEPGRHAETNAPEPAATAGRIARPDGPLQPAADTAPAVAPVVDRDRVPTVSNVVWHLNGTTEPEPGSGEAGQADDAAADDGTSFTMLEAAVAALNVTGAAAFRTSQAIDFPTAEDKTIQPEIEPASAMERLEPATDDAGRAEPEPESIPVEVDPPVSVTEAVVETQPPAVAEAVLQEPMIEEPVVHEPVVDEPVAREPIMPEVDLLSSFAQMRAMPYLPPEVGTAVIFAKPPQPEPPVGESVPVAVAPAVVEAAVVESVVSENAVAETAVAEAAVVEAAVPVTAVAEAAVAGPVAIAPVTATPVVTEPVAVETGAIESAVPDSVSTASVAAQPVATDTAAIEQVAPEAVASEPKVEAATIVPTTPEPAADKPTELKSVVASEPAATTPPEAASDVHTPSTPKPAVTQPLEPDSTDPLADALFEPENDPAAFLFEPEPGAFDTPAPLQPARAEPSVPQPAQASALASAQESMSAPPPVKITTPVAAPSLAPTPTSAARELPVTPAPRIAQPPRVPLLDPLTPLKSMSDEEKIALFS